MKLTQRCCDCRQPAQYTIDGRCDPCDQASRQQTATAAGSISNIHIDSVNYDATECAIVWTQENKRHHVWATLPDLTIRHDAIYRNPPTGTKHGDYGWFSTRTLDATAKIHAKTLAEVLTHVREHNLVDAALQAKEQANERARLQREENARIHAMKEAGPDLAKALIAIANGATGYLDRDSELAAIAQAALKHAGIPF